MHHGWNRPVSALVLATGLAALALVLPAWAGARLQIDPTQHDTGQVEEGTPAVMETVLANVGDRDLTIKDIQTN
jgi:hypothetical protein